MNASSTASVERVLSSRGGASVEGTDSGGSESGGRDGSDGGAGDRELLDDDGRDCVSNGGELLSGRGGKPSPFGDGVPNEGDGAGPLSRSRCSLSR
jgi:hypothetical protein